MRKISWILACFLYEGKYDLGREKLFRLRGKVDLFYLTDEDVVLSMTSAPGADECSGLYLDAFAGKAAQVLDFLEKTE